MDKSPKDQLANRIKEANNVLVTVSANPSVDQLSAAIGFTLFLGKLKKHATVVFSGKIPSTLEFLKPEETIETNTDSLQDFIIALDKNKADKIRYKVEDQVVKIFITPYRSSIDQEDLQFSKGDFNVDVVVALGVHSKDDLDQAITAHGRILHDATVATVNLKEGSELGAINWTDPKSSSLCEMVVVLADMVKANSFDTQMSTALLTGIVAETERFSNEKTSSGTMNASAKLMAAGANQQLVATKLEEPEPPAPEKPKEEDQEKESEPEQEEESSDGTLRIAHDPNEPRPPSKAPPKKEEQKKTEPEPEPEPRPEPEPESTPEPEPEEPAEPEKPIEQIDINPEGELEKKEPPKPESEPEALPKTAATPQIEPEHRKFLEAPPPAHNTDTVEGGPAGQSMPGRQGMPPPPSDSHMVSEPPSMGGKLSAMADDFHADEGDETPLNLPPAEPPILSHDSAKKAKEEAKAQPKQPPEPPAKPLEPRPEPKPEPAVPPQPKPEPPATPEPKPNLAQAAPPPSPPPVTPPPAQPPLSPSPPEPPAPPEPHGKLPSSFINTLDERTLKELEQKTSSPHRTQTASSFGDKTLQSIEKTVGSSHQDQPSPAAKPQPAPTPPAKPIKKTDTALSYEPHESEPPEKPAAATAPPKPLAPPSQTPPSKPVIQPPTKPTPPKPTPTPPKPEPPKQADDTASARDAVAQALNAHDEQEPLKSVGSQGAVEVEHAEQEGIGPPAVASDLPQQTQKPSPNIKDIDEEGKVTFAPADSGQFPDNTAASVDNPTAPPPVPPPMMPPTSSDDNQ